MWNEFEKYKSELSEQYSSPVWQGGIDTEQLKTDANKILYGDGDIPSKKARAIAYILENTPICITEHDFFQDQMNHANIMLEFLNDRVWSVICETVGGDSYSEAYQSGTATPVMDFGHIAPDWDFLMKNGIVGVLKRLRHYKDINDKSKQPFYDNSILVYEAIITYINRLANAAEKYKTDKMRFCADNLRQLTVSAPQNLAQAMQLTFLIYFIQWKLDTTQIRSLGGIDRLYYPFFKRDTENKTFTIEQVRELTDDFLWKINAMRVTANTPFNICGKDENGSGNEYTLLLLEEYQKLNIFDPKMHLLYYKDTNKEIINRILKMIRSGNNSFVFINADTAEKALCKIGIEPQDAQRLTVFGCYEVSAEGNEVPCTCASYSNMAKAVEYVFTNGMDSSVNTQLGVKTGEDFKSFDDFMSAIKTQLKTIADIPMKLISRYEPFYNIVCPSPVMSASYQCSCERGLDLYSGGAKYSNSSIIGVGIATLADSCTAVKKIVFTDKIISFSELKQALLSNWNGFSRIQNICKTLCPKYGNNDNEADSIAIELAKCFADHINSKPNGRGGVFRCALFSVDTRFQFGKKTCATPDGRFSGDALSKNAAASIGQDKNGVTSLINSALKLNMTDFPGGCVADIVLHSSAVAGDDGMFAFQSLLQTYMNQGGASIHFNVLDPKSLIAAQKEPEKYRNLQIRLCGWNVRFVDLSKKEQDEFILQASAEQ